MHDQIRTLCESKAEPRRRLRTGRRKRPGRARRPQLRVEHRPAAAVGGEAPERRRSQRAGVLARPRLVAQSGWAPADCYQRGNPHTWLSLQARIVVVVGSGRGADVCGGRGHELARADAAEPGETEVAEEEEAEGQTRGADSG